MRLRTFVVASVVGLWIGFATLAYAQYLIIESLNTHSEVIFYLLEESKGRKGMVYL